MRLSTPTSRKVLQLGLWGISSRWGQKPWSDIWIYLDTHRCAGIESCGCPGLSFPSVNFQKSRSSTPFVSSLLWVNPSDTAVALSGCNEGRIVAAVLTSSCDLLRLRRFVNYFPLRVRCYRSIPLPWHEASRSTLSSEVHRSPSTPSLSSFVQFSTAYHHTTGLPALPPLFGLGFHRSRYAIEVRSSFHTLRA